MPTPDSRQTLPETAENLPTIAITPDLLAACHKREGLLESIDRAVIRRVTTLAAMLPSPGSHVRAAEARGLAAQIGAHTDSLPDLRDQLAAVEREIGDLAIQAIMGAAQRAQEAEQAEAEQEHIEAETRRQAKAEAEQYAAERRGTVRNADDDFGEIATDAGRRVFLHSSVLAKLPWHIKAGHRVQFEIDNRGGKPWATNLIRLQQSANEPWQAEDFDALR